MSEAPSPWNPSQYELFKAERSRPFYDLLALVRPRTGMRVVDLGCGTGELTRELHARLGAKDTLGIDSSETMLAKAAAFAGDGLRFAQARIEEWAPEAAVDLVFSNAALQWVDGQEALFSRMKRALASGGQIAVQVPANEDHPSHAIAREIAAEAPFRDELGGFVRTTSNLALERYAEVLHGLGFGEMNVRMQVYGHPLASSDGVVEWVKGTLLTDYAKRLSAETFARFLERYRAEVRRRLGEGKPFFFTFKRFLVWGGPG